MNSLMKEVIKDLGIKAIGTYVVVESAAEVKEEFNRRVEAFQEHAVTTINTLASELDLEIEVNVRRLEIIPVIIIREGDFVYRHYPTKYFYDLERMVTWVKDYSERWTKESYAYQNAYEQYMAKNLPKI